MTLKSLLLAPIGELRVNEFLIRAHRHDSLVLCFHGVVQERRPDSTNFGNWVTASDFRDQLVWLRRHFEPISLAQFREWEDGEWRKRKPPLLITFDDGYQNNLDVAAPILLEQACPAVFFLATGYIGTDRMLWTDEVRVRVLDWPDPVIQLPRGYGQKDQQRQMPPSMAQRTQLMRQIKQACKELSERDRSTYLGYLRARMPASIPVDDPEARAFMGWDGARRLAKMGFDIGSHTEEHCILSRLDRIALLRELRNSKETIEREIGCNCLAIAYPNGQTRDISEFVYDGVRAAGYSYGFMATPDWQRRGGDLLRIQRISVPGHQNLDTFQFYASGLRDIWR